MVRTFSIALLWLGNFMTSGCLVGRPTCAPATTRLTLQPVGISTETSNPSPYIIKKSHHDHEGSQSEQLWTLVTFQGGVSVSSNKRPLVVWLTAASQCFQRAGVANFPTSLSFYSCVTMGWESSVHSECILPPVNCVYTIKQCMQSAILRMLSE